MKFLVVVTPPFIYQFVYVWCQWFDELVKGDYAGFLETVHTLVDLKVLESVGWNDEFVFIFNLLWDFGRVDTHVLVVRHVGAEVEIGNVYAKVACYFVSVRDGAVYV